MSNRTLRGAIPLMVASVVTLTAACTGATDGRQRAVTTSTAVAPARNTSCTAGDARAATSTATVRHLHTASGSVWVWIESSPRPPVHVGAFVKVVWRITGRGAPRVRLLAPNRRAARLTFGPELHARSTFHHPGAEYGTGFTPDVPGCWTLTMRRGAVAGSIPFSVAR